MNRKKATIFVLFVVMIGSLLLAISKGTRKEDGVSVSNCDNVFVISDFHQIYLFEHGTNSTDVKLLNKYENRSNDGAFYDCRRKIIVSPYGAKGTKRKSGVTIFDLSNGSSKDHEISEGMNGQIGRYKNGVLVLTALIKHKKIDLDMGYVFPRRIIPRDYVLANQKNFPKEVVEDYKVGKLWKSFTYTHFFDLDKREVTASYEKYMTYGHVVGDWLFAKAPSEGFLKIDLKTGYAEKLLERKTSFTEKGVFESVPTMSTPLFTDTSQYWISSLRSWDAEYGRDSQKLLNYEKNTIYEVENETLKKVVTSPYEDMRYVVAPDDNLYIFAPRSQKVAKFNTQTRKLKEYDLALTIPQNWYLDSVGYTKDNFIIAVSWYGYRAGGMFVVSRDFSKVSELYKLPMSSMNIATSLNIQTSHERAINTHLCSVDRKSNKPKPTK